MAVRLLEAELEGMRTRVASLEAWILDKENNGHTVRVYIQNTETGQYLQGSECWVDGREQALTFDSTLNTVHYCRKNRVPNARLMLQLQRNSGEALIPLDLAT